MLSIILLPKSKSVYPVHLKIIFDYFSQMFDWQGWFDYGGKMIWG